MSGILFAAIATKSESEKSLQIFTLVRVLFLSHQVLYYIYLLCQFIFSLMNIILKDTT